MFLVFLCLLLVFMAWATVRCAVRGVPRAPDDLDESSINLPLTLRKVRKQNTKSIRNNETKCINAGVRVWKYFLCIFLCLRLYFLLLCRASIYRRKSSPHLGFWAGFSDPTGTKKSFVRSKGCSWGFSRFFWRLSIGVETARHNANLFPCPKLYFPWLFCARDVPTQR